MTSFRNICRILCGVKATKGRQGVRGSQFWMLDLDDWLDCIIPLIDCFKVHLRRRFNIFGRLVSQSSLLLSVCLVFHVKPFVFTPVCYLGSFLLFSGLFWRLSSSLHLAVIYASSLQLPQYVSPASPSLSQPGVQLSPPSLCSLCSLSWVFFFSLIFLPLSCFVAFLSIWTLDCSGILPFPLNLYAR